MKACLKSLCVGLAIVGIVYALYKVIILFIDIIEEQHDNWKKMKEFYSILINWIKIYKKKLSFSDYLDKHGYKNVAIYGMNEIGKIVGEELMANDCLVCGIDENAGKFELKMSVYNPKSIPDNIDVIIVAAIHYYDDIYANMIKKVKCPIISLDKVTKEILSYS